MNTLKKVTPKIYIVTFNNVITPTAFTGLRQTAEITNIPVGTLYWRKDICRKLKTAFNYTTVKENENGIFTVISIIEMPVNKGKQGSHLKGEKHFGAKKKI